MREISRLTGQSAHHKQRHDLRTQRSKAVNRSMKKDLGSMSDSDYQKELQNLSSSTAPLGYHMTAPIAPKEDQITSMRWYADSERRELDAMQATEDG